MSDFEFVAFRDGTVNAARTVDPDDPEYMLQAFIDLRDSAQVGDVIHLVAHEVAFCTCPDELGLRKGCIFLSEHIVS